MNSINDLTPISPIHNIGNRCSIDIKQGGNFCIRMISFAENFADCINVFLSKFSHGMVFSFKGITSTFQHFINIVQFLSTEYQVLRINTKRIITGMHNKFPLWHWSIIIKLKGYLMRGTSYFSHSNCSITGCSSTSDPQPTIIWPSFNRFIGHTFFKCSIVALFISICISSHTDNYMVNMGICQGLF